MRQINLERFLRFSAIFFEARTLPKHRIKIGFGQRAWGLLDKATPRVTG